MTMGTPGSGRRRTSGKVNSAEEQALDLIAQEAESRLAARRQARAEAREIRMKELERQQKEAEDQGLDSSSKLTPSSSSNYDSVPTTFNEPVSLPNIRTNNKTPLRESTVLSSRTPSHLSSYSNSRRSSEDSNENNDLDRTREIRHQLNDLEDKFRKAMINNAQLDNEKAALRHQLDLMKDEAEERDENYSLLNREIRESHRLYETLKHDHQVLKTESCYLQQALQQRDKLIQEHGLLLVDGGCDEEDVYNNPLLTEDGSDNSSTATSDSKTIGRTPMLLSQQAVQLLEEAGDGSLDVRLKRFAEEKQDLIDQVNRLRLDLESEQMKSMNVSCNYDSLASINDNDILNRSGDLESQRVNGPELKLMEMHREANKQLSDYKFRMKKAEQEVLTLQGSVTRLENQVSRYKSAAENAEKAEDEIRTEKRKIQRELREAQSRVEELVTANNHLQKRIEKLKSARNAMVKT